MAMLLCEVPLNKDTHIERGREREATAAVELLLVHITHTKSICAEVAPVAFWVIGVSKVQHHSLLLSPPPAGITVGFSPILYC